MIVMIFSYTPMVNLATVSVVRYIYEVIKQDCPLHL